MDFNLFCLDMHIFKAKWIVLRLLSKNEKDFLYSIFFEQYGKLAISYKRKTKEKMIDIGNIFSGEISTQEGRKVHSLRNIKIKNFFHPKEKSFEEISLYLEILSLVEKKLIEGNPVPEIFSLLEILGEKSEKLTYEKLLLAKLKVISIFGELRSHDTDEVVEKILKFIHHYSIKDILKLKWLEEETIEKLKKI